MLLLCARSGNRNLEFTVTDCPPHLFCRLVFFCSISDYHVGALPPKSRPNPLKAAFFA